jgi:SWI/SNF-related matrix-associated actin-dependent regulator 1 of chromatin subfamily A
MDECQYVKSWQAKRTKAALSLGRNKPHILALSGTPLTNRPKELYNVLHLLLPEQFPSFVSYAWRYCARHMTQWGWDDRGASHLEELHTKLKDTCMIRRRKRQVLKELPEKQRSVILLPVDLKEYHRAEDDFLNWLAEQDTAKAARASQAEKLVQLGYLKQLAAKLKIKAVMDWMDDYFESTDAKLVVFAYHKAIIQLLHQKYKKFSVVLDGSTSQSLRLHNVQKFQQDKHTRLFIGQLIAAGTAITLTAASTAAFVELDWTPGNHIQAEDRLHRIGQKAHTQIYYIVSKGTIEEDLCAIIQSKAKTITSVLDGRKRKDELNVFDKLMKLFYERSNNG